MRCPSVLRALVVLAIAACAPQARRDARSGPSPTRVRPVATATARETARETARATSEAADYLRSRRLLVPVAGVPVDRLRDTFGEARGNGGRRHEAIDILAPRGTPVLATDAGRILKLRRNAAGGITIYATDPRDRVIYYYAHLDRYHGSLREGMKLAQGDTIGFVGTTGNAPRNIPHLHFQITRMPPDGRWWGGEPIDPLPLLVQGEPARN